MAEEKKDDQILIRLPKSLKAQLEGAARVEGTTAQEWIRTAIQNRIGLLNVCPVCGTVNSGTAKFCNECGASLKDSKRAMYVEWLRGILKDEFGEREDFDKILAFIENPAGEQAKIEKRGKWVVRTEERGE
ncbi:MAG: zinc ribbon domain-containing protein [Bacilli bacterium]